MSTNFSAGLFYLATAIGEARAARPLAGDQERTIVIYMDREDYVRLMIASQKRNGDIYDAAIASRQFAMDGIIIRERLRKPESQEV